MNVFIVLLIVFCLIIVLGSTIFAVFLVLGPIFTGFKKAPYVPSFDVHLHIMKQHLKFKKNASIVDLGCGDGKALRFFFKEFGLRCVGYDLNPFAIRYGKLLNMFLKSVHIQLIRSDFKKAKLQNYDYVYVYLWPEQLVTIENRLFDHITNDAIIISNSFAFTHHVPFEVVYDDNHKKTIYLYRK